MAASKRIVMACPFCLGGSLHTSINSFKLSCDSCDAQVTGVNAIVKVLERNKEK